MRGSAFFEGVSQAEVTIAGQEARLPIFYYDGSAMTAMFPARLSALKRLMPDPSYVPARLAPGVGIVSITALEYRDTDIGPYNELAIAIPLNYPAFLPNLPGRALIASLRRRQAHALIHHLPVTTKVALDGGRDYYNFPKFIARIDFAETASQRVAELAEGEEPILTLTARRIPTRHSATMQMFSHLYQDGRPQGAEFKVNAPQIGIAARPGTASLELGDRHPISRELGSLLRSRRALSYQYMEGFEAILYGPERLSLTLMEKVEQARAGIPASASK